MNGNAEKMGGYQAFGIVKFYGANKIGRFAVAATREKTSQAAYRVA